MKKKQIFLIIVAFVAVVAVFAFISDKELFTARVALRSVSPDYTLSYSLNVPGTTVASSFFANNGNQFYSTRKVSNSFEVLSYSADNGALLWSRVQPVPGDADLLEILSARGARTADIFVTLHKEFLPSIWTYRIVLSKFSSASNGIPDWTRVVYQSQYDPTGVQKTLLISGDGSRMGVLSKTTPLSSYDIFVYTSQGALHTTVIGWDQYTSFAALSSDGSTLVSNGNNSLGVYHLNSASPNSRYNVILSPDYAWNINSFSVSNNGEFIAFWSGGDVDPAAGTGRNRIRIVKKQPDGYYSGLFTDDIGMQDYRVPGTEHLPFLQQWYEPMPVLNPTSSFNDLDELIVGTTYYYDSPTPGLAHTKNNVFSYRKTANGTFERVSRYSHVFPKVENVNGGVIHFNGVTPVQGSNFLVSFISSPLPGSPEAFIINPYDGYPKKVFNFPVTISNSVHSSWSIRGRGDAPPNGSLVSYTYDLSGDVTNSSVVHVPIIPISLATDGSFVDRVRVSWNRVPGASAIDVFRGTIDDVFSATQLNPSPLRALSYLDYSAVPGQIYYYWVRARSAGNAFSFSKSDTGYRAIFPIQPTNLTAQNLSDRVVLSWNYPSNPPYDIFPGATFNVYRSDTQTVPTTGTPYASNVAVRTYTDSNPLPLGSRNYYAVVAVNAAGASSPSNVAAGYRFIPPQNLRFLTVAGSSIDLAWTTPSNPPGSIAGYNIFYNTSGEACGGTTVPVGNVSSHTVTGLSPGVRYYLSMQTRGNNEVSECSSVLNARTFSGCTIPGSVDNGNNTCSVEISNIFINGHVYGRGPTWESTRNPPIQNIGVSYQINNAMYALSHYETLDSTFSSWRSVLTFNVSSLSNHDILDAAFEGVSPWTTGASGGSDVIYLVPWTPTNPQFPYLYPGDYFGFDWQSSNRLAAPVDIGTIPPVPATVQFPFNMAGKTYFQNSLASGRLSIGIVEHDAFAGNPFTGGGASFYTSREANPAYRPKLIVIYR